MPSFVKVVSDVEYSSLPPKQKKVQTAAASASTNAPPRAEEDASLKKKTKAVNGNKNDDGDGGGAETMTSKANNNSSNAPQQHSPPSPPPAVDEEEGVAVEKSTTAVTSSSNAEEETKEHHQPAAGKEAEENINAINVTILLENNNESFAKKGAAAAKAKEGVDNGGPPQEGLDAKLCVLTDLAPAEEGEEAEAGAGIATTPASNPVSATTTTTTLPQEEQQLELTPQVGQDPKLSACVNDEGEQQRSARESLPRDIVEKLAASAAAAAAAKRGAITTLGNDKKKCVGGNDGPAAASTGGDKAREEEEDAPAIPAAKKMATVINVEMIIDPPEEAAAASAATVEEEEAKEDNAAPQRHAIPARKQPLTGGQQDPPVASAVAGEENAKKDNAAAPQHSIPVQIQQSTGGKKQRPAADIEIIELDDDDSDDSSKEDEEKVNDASPPSKKPPLASSTNGNNKGNNNEEGRGNVGSSTISDNNMVLPEKYTKALKTRLEKLAKSWANQTHQVMGRSSTLNTTTINAIAHCIPTSMEELSKKCGINLGSNFDKYYGEWIIKAILDFVRSEKLEQYLIGKVTVNGGGSGDNENGDNRSNNEHSNGQKQKSASLANNVVTATAAAEMANKGSSLAKSSATGNDDDGVVLPGMVLPKLHTSALEEKLAELFISWASEEHGTGKVPTLDWDNFSLKIIQLISSRVPTTMEELQFLPNNFNEKYGALLLGNVKSFITMRKLQKYIDSRPFVAPGNLDKYIYMGALLGQHPLKNTTTHAPPASAANIIVTQPAPAAASRLSSSTTTNPTTGIGIGNNNDNNNGQSNTGVRHNSNNCPPVVHTRAIRPNPSSVKNNLSSQRYQGKNAILHPAQSAPVANAIVNSSNNRNRTIIERWSEYRIDAAPTINDLESIRHRLLTLVERVNDRLKEKRLVEALTQVGEEVGGAGENVEELTTQELMDRLTNEMNKSTETENGATPSNNEGSTTNGKRSIDKVSDIADMNKKENKRQRPSAATTCPLCFDKITSPSSTCGTCEICEENNICNSCHSVCECCRRITCDDCLMSCDACGSRYHCSDCMMFGGGKCVVCRPKKAGPKSICNGNGTSSGALRQPSNQRGFKNGMSSLGRANEMVGYPQFYPPPNPLLCPSFARTLANHQWPSSLAQGVANPTQHGTNGLSQSYSHPQPNPLPSTHSAAQTTVNQVQPTLYSVHRFIVSEGGLLGLHVTLKTKTRTCLVSTVKPSSVADKLGVELNDEIFLPSPTTTGVEPPNTYKLFLEAAKSRPLLFEVKRPFKPAPANLSYPLQGQLSLHRFVINQQGTLGMTLEKVAAKDHALSRVSSVDPNSLSAKYGVRQNDIICKPFSNGLQKINTYEWFLQAAKHGTRPLIFEVWRSVPTSMSDVRPRRTGTNENPFIFSFTETSIEKEAEANVAAKGTRSTVEKDNQGQVSKPSTNNVKGNSGKDSIIVLDDDSADDSFTDAEEKKGGD